MARIGILVPRSRQYPQLSFQFIEGLKNGLSGNPELFKDIFIEDIGVETSSNLVMDKCQKLLLQYQVDVVIAYINNQFSEELRNLFHSLKKIVIIVNLGENKIVHTPSRYVFDHTLGVWESCWEMGYYLASNGKKRVIIASSFYDSGYGLLNAFTLGLTEGGGEICNYVFSPDIPTPTDLLKLEQAVKEQQPDIVYAIYSGNYAKGFMENYYKNEYLKSFPLAGSPFLIEEKETAQNKLLITAPFKTGETESPFSLLGYETGKMISTSIYKEGQPLTETDKIIGNLENISIDSPRETLTMNPENHITEPVVYLMQVGGNIEFSSQQINDLKSNGTNYEEAGLLTGFTNPYLCM